MARRRKRRAPEPPGPAGFLVVDKPAGWTSHDVVDAARAWLGTRRVGHLGTLDPQATGVLPLAVRAATKLAPFLEACLLGLPEGTQQTFELSPAQAFGERSEELIQRISRATLEENSSMDEDYRVGDLVDFAAPGGGRFAGILRAIDDDGAIFDFNHPLAGQTLKFEVKIIGIL